MQTRRAQPAVTIRSQQVVDRLKLLTRDGRSQVEIVEEALARMPEPSLLAHDDDRWAGIAEIQAQARRETIPSMAEFDAREYDENGSPR